MYITEIGMFIKKIKTDYLKWGGLSYPWFRGLPDSKYELIPKLYRDDKYLKEPDINYRNKYIKTKEVTLVQLFRMRSSLFGVTPNEGNYDEWLFLMQHFGLATRLLDWTESALVALFFALNTFDEKKHLNPPVVWMLNPYKLNKESIKINDKIPLSTSEKGMLNFRASFMEDPKEETELPVAILSKYVHERMFSQKSCFTIHGKNKGSIEELFEYPLIQNGYLTKYEIDPKKVGEILNDLKVLGISSTTIFPDFGGLSEELNNLKFEIER